MVFIHLRDASNDTRTRLDDVNLTDNVATIKSKSGEKLGISVKDQRLVYMGRILDDCQPLNTYDISEGCTVYILKTKDRSENNQELDEPPNKSWIIQLSQKVMKFPIYQSSVKQLLKKPDTHERLIASIPSLKKDSIACALLKDHKLFLTFLETANFDKVMQDHPSLVQAAEFLITEIDNKRTQSRQLMLGNQSGASETNEIGMDPGLLARAEVIAAQEEALQQQHQQDARPQQISPMQLAMALSQAGMTPEPTTAGPSQQPSGQSSSQASSHPFQPFPPTLQHLPQPSTSSQPTTITSDFFSQAIASAMASTSQASNSAQTASNQAALQQMRGMGIMDDALSLRALAQTNGDVQAALNLIFEGGLE